MKKFPIEFQPDQVILARYADVLVNFALGETEGISPGDVVQVLVPDIAKPLAKELQKSILNAGGHMLLRLLPTGFDADYYALANQEQLTFFPKKHLKTRAELIDHSIGIIADPDPEELKSADPAKIFASRDAQKQYRDWLMDKEQAGKFTWTLGLWGVQAKADLVGLSLEEYWQQIISACFLDESDPIAKWRQVKKTQQKTREALNQLLIDHLHITGPDVDLVVKLGPNRIWKGGADRNIPSFELFTSPDWRGSQGWMRFNQPLYRYGNILRDVRLEFHNGVVTKATANQGQEILDEMIKSENANKIGEFSLTDARLSRITHPMAETLYDENIGGAYGNSHIAIGMAYRDCYRGDQRKIKKSQWKAMGFNNSPEHTDIVSTTDRTVEAHLVDGTKKIIYRAGKFTV